MPGAVLGAGGTTENQTDELPAHLPLPFWLGRHYTHERLCKQRHGTDDRQRAAGGPWVWTVHAGLSATWCLGLPGGSPVGQASPGIGGVQPALLLEPSQTRVVSAVGRFSHPKVSRKVLETLGVFIDPWINLLWEWIWDTSWSAAALPGKGWSLPSKVTLWNLNNSWDRGVPVEEGTRTWILCIPFTCSETLGPPSSRP